MAGWLHCFGAGGKAEHDGRVQGRETLLTSHGTESEGGERGRERGREVAWVPIFLSGLRKWR